MKLTDRLLALSNRLYAEGRYTDADIAYQAWEAIHDEAVCRSSGASVSEVPAESG